MKLTISDRILLLNLDTLSKNRNLTTLRVQRVLAFTDEELTKWKLRQEDSQVLWENPEDGGETDIPLTEPGLELIKKALQESNALAIDHLPLAEKFGV